MTAAISLADISQNSVFEAQQWLIPILAKRFPGVNFSSGATYGLIVVPHAIACGAVQELLNRVKQSQSLYTASQAEHIDEETIKALLDNFDIALKQEDYAAGSVRISLTADSYTHIRAGTAFVDPLGQVFRASDDVFAYPTTYAGALGTNETKLEKIGAYYYFSVPVTAEKPGKSGNISQDTVLTCVLSIPFLHGIAAETTFTGGRDTETIAEARSRVYLSRNAAVLGGNLQLLNYFKLKAQENDDLAFLDAVISVSRIGAHSPFMMRDRRGIFPISTGGKEDIYVKTTKYPDYKLVKAPALLIDILPSGDGVWKTTLGRNHVAGAYHVAAVYRLSDTTNGYNVTDLTVLPDTTSGGIPFIPDVESGPEAAFSAFQSFSVQFVDTNTPVTNEQIGVRTQEYLFKVVFAPHIFEIQSFLCSQDVWPPFLDFLVRACLPAYASVTIFISNSISDELKQTIQREVSEYIGNLPIGNTIYTSQIASIVRPLLPETVVIDHISIAGTIYDIHGGQLTLPASNTYISIPTNLLLGISPATVGWFIQDSNITFQVI